MKKKIYKINCLFLRSAITGFQHRHGETLEVACVVRKAQSNGSDEEQQQLNAPGNEKNEEELEAIASSSDENADLADENGDQGGQRGSMFACLFFTEIVGILVPDLFVCF